jgi:hypothetical protein
MLFFFNPDFSHFLSISLPFLQPGTAYLCLLTSGALCKDDIKMWTSSKLFSLLLQVLPNTKLDFCAIFHFSQQQRLRGGCLVNWLNVPI